MRRQGNWWFSGSGYFGWYTNQNFRFSKIQEKFAGQSCFMTLTFRMVLVASLKTKT